MNVKKIAEEIKQAVDVSQLDPKLQNRVKELKRIHQQIKEIEDSITKQVGDLQKQVKVLEKQSTIFEKEIYPELKRLEDHIIKAEGIEIELKSGKRSPKVGYEFLASKVTSELLAAAEEAIAKAAEFAQSPSVTVASKKTASTALDWLINKFKSVIDWAKSLANRNKKLDSLLVELEQGA